MCIALSFRCGTRRITVSLNDPPLTHLRPEGGPKNRFPALQYHVTRGVATIARKDDL